MKEMAGVRDEVEGWRRLVRRIQDTSELAEMDDESMRAELESEVGMLEVEMKKRELDTLLSGPYDQGNALLTINSGSGGADSNDWAAMLERMYLRWIERRGFEAEILDVSEGEEAGIKSVTIAVNGKYAYGYLHPENGVHRLVRLSPFDAAHRRHTSFASVEVLPEINDDDTIHIPPEDVRIDIFRSSGAGGQNVQKNSTAIRLTHIPTGMVVTCQNERSQLQNRENAMRVLRARLLAIQRQEQEKQIADLRGVFVKIDFGSQIRSYVIHPYQMVKDHRTEYEVGNTQGVFDGDIDGFIEAFLKSQRN
jgi:peptide chain release factor 2